MCPLPLVRSFGSRALVSRTTPEHVRLEHPAPLVEVGVLDAVQAERPAGTVHDDVNLVEAGNEVRDRGVIGDVELDRPATDLGRQSLTPVHPARC